MKFLPLVLAGLRRKKLRTLLTFLSIFVAFLLFGFLAAIKAAFGAGIEVAGQDRLFTGHKVSMIQTLPQSYQGRIRSVPGVSAVAHQTWFGGIYQDPKNFFASMPVEPEAFLDLFPEYQLPEDQRKTWLATRTGAIVGRTIAEKFKWKIGDRIPLQSPIWGTPAGMNQWEFEITGIYTGAKKSTDTSGFYFHYDYFEEARPRNKGQVGWFTIRVADPAQAANVALKIDELFANSPYETKTQPEGAAAQGFAQQIGDIATIVLAVVGAVFFTILLVAGNTMAQSVRERTEELGVLKALGFTNGRVLRLVMTESCLIATLAGLAGLAAAWLVSQAGSPVPNVLPIFFIPTKSLLTGALLALALGLVAGALPATQAMRLRIADALRRGG